MSADLAGAKRLAIIAINAEADVQLSAIYTDYIDATKDLYKMPWLEADKLRENAWVTYLRREFVIKSELIRRLADVAGKGEQE